MKQLFRKNSSAFHCLVVVALQKKTVGAITIRTCTCVVCYTPVSCYCCFHSRIPTQTATSIVIEADAHSNFHHQI